MYLDPDRCIYMYVNICVYILKIAECTLIIFSRTLVAQLARL